MRFRRNVSIAPLGMKYGPLSERPLASAVPAGFTYIASDAEEAVSDGTTWHSRTLGRVGYTEKTNGPDYVVTAGRKDIPNLQVITFDVNAGEEYEVRLFVGRHIAAVLNASAIIYISDNAGADAAAAIKATGPGPSCYQNATAALGQIVCYERITTPGSYARKGQAESLTGNVTVKVGTGANAIPPLTLTAERVK